MKRLVLFMVLIVYATIISGQIIRVPADQPTIQAGIDVANNGETVLVDPGTYVENISFNGKIITVASLFLTTQDTSYISQTVIDGNQAESVVTFTGGENPLTLLCGLTLTNGAGNDALGGGINCQSASPWIENVNIINNLTGWKGGGLYCYLSNPILENVKISNNIVTGNGPLAYDCGYGGGICCEQSSPVLMGVTICNNTVYGLGGGIYCLESEPVFNCEHLCSIYQNEAFDGADLYSLTFLDVILDTFTVLYPTDFYATPLDNFSFDLLNGIVQQVDADLYISPDGNNSNSGLTPDEPLKNISSAFPIIRADSSHQHTIYLTEGTYSPDSTCEDFPIKLIDYVNLEGTSESGVIIDADSAGGVLQISHNASNTVSNMTLTGVYEGRTGGVDCNYSSPTMQNLLITGNHSYIQLLGGSAGAGGGIAFSHSSPALVNIEINNNSGGSTGGGIFADNSILDLTNVVIRNNSAGSGGGIYLHSSEAEFHNVSICNNIANWFCSMGGGIYASGSSIFFDEEERCNIHTNAACYGNEIYSDLPMVIVTDTFTVQNPTEFLAYPIYNFAFDVLNPLFAQASADLYVSIYGNNLNSGLTADNPLQTIHCALSVIIPDSQDPYTIHLLEGLYSDSSNNELFPLAIPDYINLSGTSPDEVILDAENNSGVMHIANNSSNTISGLTAMRGSKSGITILYSSPLLKNMNIKENHRSYGVGGCGGGFGGGIFCEYGDPMLQNVTLSDNWAAVTGGSAYFEDSNPSLVNVLITNNEYQRLSCKTSYLEIINSTIIDHQIFLEYGSVCKVINSIIWNEISEYGIYLGQGAWSILTISDSDIRNGQLGIGGSGTTNWLGGNIDDDPLFAGQGEHPFALSADSPCIDAGTADTTGLNLPPGDIIGNVRIWDGNGDGSTIIDMGAYEYGSIPVGIETPLIQNSIRQQTDNIQSYPNPFSIETTIEFHLPINQQVSLKIFDITGREIETLVSGRLDKGDHTYTMNAVNLQSGIYLYRLSAGGDVVSGKLVVRKK